MNEQTRPVDQEIIDIFSLFLDETPVSAELIDTSRGEEDFRNTYIIGTAEGNRIVLKITANEFTFPEKIRMWARTIDEYRGLGYYCPKIFCDKNGGFPVIRCKDRDCVAYAEEFSKYGSFEERISGDADTQNADTGRYLRDIWTMTAKIAAKRLDYTEYPSAWCLYDLGPLDRKPAGPGRTVPEAPGLRVPGGSELHEPAGGRRREFQRRL